MKVEIDDKSGFCFGVVNAITKAELELKKGNTIYSIGDIMHNSMEMQRLNRLGLKTIDVSHISSHKGEIVLVRAHGEPPSTYNIAKENNVILIDATCPVVAKLQEHVKEAYQLMNEVDGQVVILGKKGHPEIIGLNGQIDNNAIIIECCDDLVNIDFNRDIYMLSQTTQSIRMFDEIKNKIKTQSKANVIVKDTICRQVANRFQYLRTFCSSHDLILFVSGAHSSNGKALYDNCCSVNSRCYKIESGDDLDDSWFEGVQSVGVCGATSTPKWLMEQIAEIVREK